ncbi:MAG: FAD-dependent oxidoreductase, partial [Bifidobacteriaceae bacterium]|nr:FAD-dependent oxidoreductase [Bifidobacteriaceae bacterium]
MEEFMATTTDRRGFLKGAAIVGGTAAVAGIAACSPDSPRTEGSAAPGGGSGSVEPGALDWLGNPPEIDEAQIERVVETEILVVGAAAAGSFAAYGAIKVGAKVTVIDKNKTFHYGGAGTSFVNSKFQEAAGMPTYDPTKVLYELVNNTQCRADPSLLALWAFRSGQICDDVIQDILEPYGVEVTAMSQKHESKQQISGFKSTEVKFGDPNADNFRPVLSAVHQYVEDQGGEFVYNMRALVLTQDDSGRVTGVIAQDSGGTFVRYSATKGVIMCTGSYGGDQNMVKTFMSPKVQPMLESGLMYTGFMESDEVPDGTWDTGDGHKMMCWLGASMEDATHSYNGWTMTGIVSAPYLNVAQASGRRFQNEAVSFLNQLQAIVETPHEDGYYYWQILSNEPEQMPFLLDIP